MQSNGFHAEAVIIHANSANFYKALFMDCISILDHMKESSNSNSALINDIPVIKYAIDITQILYNILLAFTLVILWRYTHDAMLSRTTQEIKEQYQRLLTITIQSTTIVDYTIMSDSNKALICTL